MRSAQTGNWKLGGSNSDFGGMELGAKPTTNRSRYVVLRLNFSAFGAQLGKV